MDVCSVSVIYVMHHNRKDNIDDVVLFFLNLLGFFIVTIAFLAISSVSNFTAALVRSFVVVTYGIDITAMGSGSALVYI